MAAGLLQDIAKATISARKEIQEESKAEVGATRLDEIHESDADGNNHMWECSVLLQKGCVDDM